MFADIEEKILLSCSFEKVWEIALFYLSIKSQNQVNQRNEIVCKLYRFGESGEISISGIRLFSLSSLKITLLSFEISDSS